MGNCKRQEEQEQERVGRAACCKERTNSRRYSILFHSLLLLFDPLSLFNHLFCTQPIFIWCAPCKTLSLSSISSRIHSWLMRQQQSKGANKQNSFFFFLSTHHFLSGTRALFPYWEDQSLLWLWEDIVLLLLLLLPGNCVTRLSLSDDERCAEKAVEKCRMRWWWENNTQTIKKDF